jgi:glycosyltransferase involved in cell wall biosynthesis
MGYGSHKRTTGIILPRQDGAPQLTSGVFLEAASFGKPVVVPSGTWMSRQIATGCGVGTIFEEPSPNSVAAALLQALSDADNLSAAACAVAPRVRAENSSQRYIEKMMKLLDRRSVA